MKKRLGQILMVLSVSYALWGLLSLLWQTPVLPGPIAVTENLLRSLGQDLPWHIAYSLLRVGAATLLALSVAVPLGILLGYHESWHKILSPFIYFSYPIPKLALLPIIMLLCGLGEASKLLIVFLVIVFPILVDVYGGVAAMDKEMFQVMRSFGLSGRQICLRIILPGTVPAILTSLRVSIGIALSILFFAENYGTRHGLGYYIINSWQKMEYVNIYTGILTLSLLGLIIFLLLDTAESRLTRWR